MGQGAYIFGCEGQKLTEPERALFAQTRPFGFILFARNIADPEQVRRLTSELRASVGWDAPIFIDQEGGRVQRMGPPHWRQWIAPLDEVDTAGSNAARSMWLRGRLIAAELRDVGIDGNCAPLGDIAGDATHAILKNRCYGRDARIVATNARAMAEGLLAGGALPVLKHLPGHGRADLDAHKELPVVNAPRADLSATDFAPFADLADLPLAMTAHLVFSKIDPRPATQSDVMIQLIRDEIGFGGLLMSDDIEMEALDGRVEDRARLSREAGCDIVLHCNGTVAQMAAVAEVAGMMDETSQHRADRALSWRRAPQDCDLSALSAEYDGLVAAVSHGG